MTDEELDAISQRCSAARSGPWKSYAEGRNHAGGSNFIMVGEGTGRGDDIELSGATMEDQDFIAHARQNVPRLVEEIRRLRAQLGRKVSKLSSFQLAGSRQPVSAVPKPATAVRVRGSFTSVSGQSGELVSMSSDLSSRFLPNLRGPGPFLDGPGWPGFRGEARRVEPAIRAHHAEAR